MSGSVRWAIVGLAVACGAGLAVMRRPASGPRPVEALSRAQGTSAEQMEAGLAAAKARLAVNPADSAAAVRAAEILLRQARAQRSGGPALQAEAILTTLLEREPGEYSALKLLGAVYLSLHKFGDALNVAKRGLAVRPGDAWHYGVMGDAYLELGDRQRAFDAFDRMMTIRPDAGAYSRVSYALELQGQFPQALRAMRMATEATGADDAEGLAWLYVQQAGILGQMGSRGEARQALLRALAAYPDYPEALDALARLDQGGADRSRG
jgi:tetratricopeptide (TPR) repeat protein